MVDKNVEECFDRAYGGVDFSDTEIADWPPVGQELLTLQARMTWLYLRDQGIKEVNKFKYTI